MGYPSDVARAGGSVETRRAGERLAPPGCQPASPLVVRSEHVEGSSRYDRLRLVAGETGCARYALKEHFTPWPRYCGVCPLMCALLMARADLRNAVDA
jgi:hypothetical protein